MIQHFPGDLPLLDAYQLPLQRLHWISSFPLLLKQNMICSWMKNAVQCLIPPLHPIYSEVERQWDRFKLDAITVLAWIFLKSGRCSFVLPPPASLFHYSIAVFFQTHLRICYFCNIKCFAQNNLHFSSISAEVLIDTRLVWPILPSWQI